MATVATVATQLLGVVTQGLQAAVLRRAVGQDRKRVCRRKSHTKPPDGLYEHLQLLIGIHKLSSYMLLVILSCCALDCIQKKDYINGIGIIFRRVVEM